MIKIYDKNYTLNFGKYEGCTVEEIMDENPSYLLWCDDNIKWFEITDEELKKEIKILKERKNYRPKNYGGGSYDPAPTLGDVVHGNTGPNGGWGNQI